jgi:hypothetical protein
MSVAGATVEAIPEEGHTMSKTTTRVCPKCGNDTGIPIVYGLPGPDLMDRAERGEVVLGGCLDMDDNPEWRCMAVGCGTEWKSKQTHTPQQL